MSEAQPLSEWMRSVGMDSPNVLARPTCVYRALDVLGRSLYIGISANVKQRWLMHRSQTEWAKKTCLLIVHGYECRWDARIEEVHLIKTVNPIHNKVRDGLFSHHVDPVWTRGAALDGSTFWWVFRFARSKHGQG